MSRETVAKADAALQLLAALQACLPETRPPSPLLDDGLRALRAALSACRVAAVALCEQNERLAATVAMLEVERRDKEVLLREAYHRVKNNLQILRSLLDLQAESVHGEEARTALEESRHRINAMARLHEQLYESLESGRIRMADYLQGLVEAAGASYGARVSVAVLDPAISLDPDRAVACGLIANELLTNACKYAFPAGQPGEIGIAFDIRDAAYRLRVWDTGIGLPATVDLETSPSLGLRLVRLLAMKLQARVGIERSGGTAFTLVFPIDAPA